MDEIRHHLRIYRAIVMRDDRDFNDQMRVKQNEKEERKNKRIQKRLEKEEWKKALANLNHSDFICLD